MEVEMNGWSDRYHDTRDLTLQLVQDNAHRFRPGFYDWMAENYAIWVRFKLEADKIRASGRPHYSARTIGEYIRHETALRESGGTFKVNDWWWPPMARLYMQIEPGAAGFFETREVAGDARRSTDAGD